MNDVKNKDLSKSVIKTLLYYDIFSYPLTVEEVYQFLGTNSIQAVDVRTSLLELAGQGRVFCYGDYFSVQDNVANVHRRVKGNECAAGYRKLAQRRANLIARFPFVRAVMASGSFSKGYMDEHSDLDFFIVTAPQRLWIVRMMIVMFKRFVFFNSHKYFCCNYFIDTDHLEIEEKNLFTATELATLVPLSGAALYQNLIEANRWLTKFFPNYKMRPVDNVADRKPGPIKRWLEKLIDMTVGDMLDTRFMNLTLARWRRIYEKDYATRDFDNAFKTRRHVSKNHPRHYQRKVIERFEQKVESFSKKHKIEMEPSYGLAYLQGSDGQANAHQ